MKKRWLVLLISIFLFLPVSVKAEAHVKKYYADVTILKNGDLNIKELLIYSGNYNGIIRDIDYKGDSYLTFDGSLDSFENSTIYNGNNIILNEIKGIPYTDINFNLLKEKGDIFQAVSYAEKGDYGKYTLSNTAKGINLLIYNPSNQKKATYIEYTIKNIGVVHEDVAEFMYRIFSRSTDDIDSLEMYIHIPNNKEILRSYGHGPLTGETTNIDKNTIKVTMDDVRAGTAINIRCVFDREVLSESTKHTNVIAQDKIIELETKKADEANQKREEAREQVKKERTKMIIGSVINIIWISLTFLFIAYVYRKYDKEYKNNFQNKYFRDFPSQDTPPTVGYLIRKKVNENDLSASILDLINRKVISFQEIPGKKKDYILKKEPKEIILTPVEENLIAFLFEKEEIKLSELKKKAKSNYSSFIKKYNKWNTSATDEAKKKNFYENNDNIKTKGILFTIAGLMLSMFTMALTPTVAPITFVISMASLIYFAAFTRRTKEGNELYHKWMSLKSFMEDFGRIDKKELPEIVLWEKYLIYAVTLGCADTLAKTMELRIKDFEEYQVGDAMFDYYRFHTIISFNRIIHNSITSSVQEAYSAQSIANSSNSSGIGSGGGFSGGGFSGGGGGGVGHF